jgi:hypothetical protein
MMDRHYGIRVAHPDQPGVVLATQAEEEEDLRFELGVFATDANVENEQLIDSMQLWLWEPLRGQGELIVVRDPALKEVV